MGDSTVREDVARVLKKIGDTRAVEAPIDGPWGRIDGAAMRRSTRHLARVASILSIQSLQDEDRLVRRNAAESLARLGAKQAIEPLLPCWKTAPW
ncbi:MAG: HEAT repeat domain-containing protein [Nitrospiraceae bacterium]